MKTVLIPTNFSESSLQLLKSAVLNYPEDTLHIVFASGYRIGESLFDYMNFSNTRILNFIAAPEYLEVQKKLFEDHGYKVKNIQNVVFTGNNKYAFKDFLEMYNIDEALIPGKGFTSFVSKKCFDITPYVRKSDIKHIEVESNNECLGEERKPEGLLDTLLVKLQLK
ncbi:hypothetical protein [Mangrovimonas sp. TPBH4]|uniref:hypothetical protein n=1 Tax=Mangrovimonas sp. TPBH4 TaxID=1645914 RepID=UPI0006B528C2|nr:hypothetical protein [Mangrovimonas sp. TPBH4]